MYTVFYIPGGPNNRIPLTCRRPRGKKEKILDTTLLLIITIELQTKIIGVANYKHSSDTFSLNSGGMAKIMTVHFNSIS